MAVNKSHPKYKEYIEKCEEIAQRQKDELLQIEPTHGFDGPTTAVYKKHFKELKALQKEYSFLFEDDK